MNNLKQRDRVFYCMRSGNWRTLDEISEMTGAPQTSASAHLRDFRKKKCGAHTVLKRINKHRDDGLYEYKLLVNENVEL